MPALPDLRAIARALGGEVQGRQVLCPGPGHSRKDRSLSIRLSHQSPTGWITFSHAGDTFDVCRDHVAERLGLAPDAWRRATCRQVGDTDTSAAIRSEINVHNIHVDKRASDNTARIARAAKIWHQAAEARATVVEHYLASRGLDFVDSLHDVLRFHRLCPWRDEEAGRTIYVPAMVAALREIATDRLVGIHRTRLTLEGSKVDRRMLGQASCAAIKLDADDQVTLGLHLAEGIETALAGRQLGFQPCWALGSAGAIAAFPVLGGVEALTLLAENDDANRRAVDACAARWHQAGREVTVVEPCRGSDLNDAMRGAA